MSYSTKAKQDGTKLNLSWWKSRQMWRKMYRGKRYYFSQPDTKAGYEAALAEFHHAKIKATETRPNAALWQTKLETFQMVNDWYDRFGVPSNEKKLAAQVRDFIEWLKSQMEAVSLPPAIPLFDFTDQGRPEFLKEFGYEVQGIGTGDQIQTNSKWADRLERLTDTPKKHPQTIGYWLDAYQDRTAKRGGQIIKEASAKDRAFKLGHLRTYANLDDHITTIDEQWLDDYHMALDQAKSRARRKEGEQPKELSRDSKQDYFSVVRMFIRWASQQSKCELNAPKNLDNKDFTFRAPQGTGRHRRAIKEKLWSPDQLTKLIAKLIKLGDHQNACYVCLMANCAFRHTDLSELTHGDIDLKAGRITIQRNKNNQLNTSPIISYKLWTKTIQLIKKAKSDHPTYLFLNNQGGQIKDSIKSWWWRNRDDLGYADMRLDYIRKSGSTLISKFDRQIDDMYLGENLSTTAKIHYTFTDGEPCQALDDATDYLGSLLGYAEAPVKRVELTPEMLEVLRGAGLI